METERRQDTLQHKVENNQKMQPLQQYYEEM